MGGWVGEWEGVCECESGSNDSNMLVQADSRRGEVT